MHWVFFGLTYWEVGRLLVVQKLSDEQKRESNGLRVLVRSLDVSVLNDLL